ncbi:uncharacterized protein LOC130767045 isoform X2 [Actinidia eriantha]|uniref:uncharacterized protein LOC130767045 isoform X2 n=1 Tax=Actinidia eriantha TaxID=165200 RepID=UPI00258EE1AB|nr:uncharacterized protein LOC130767045 isoform X2 [Actinidia eriantha]
MVLIIHGTRLMLPPKAWDIEFARAQIAEENGGIMRFIHVSGLGSSPSRILRAKAAAEEAIMRELPEVSRERLFCCDKGGKNKYMEGHSSKTIV